MNISCTVFNFVELCLHAQSVAKETTHRKIFLRFLILFSAD